jgi:hypothetical protein
MVHLVAMFCVVRNDPVNSIAMIKLKILGIGVRFACKKLLIFDSLKNYNVEKITESSSQQIPGIPHF